MTQREEELTKQLAQRDILIAQLKEELYLARHRLFGRKTETAVLRNLPLFDELPIGIVEKPTENQPHDPPAHTRAKKTGRRPLNPELPRVEVIHDLTEEEKKCACGSTLVKIGEEVSERLVIIPRKVQVERHVRCKYACHACEGSGDEDKPAVRIAPVEPSIIPKSITKPSLLATILVSKFCDHLPFYRQEEILARDGLDLCRQDMAN